MLTTLKQQPEWIRIKLWAANRRDVSSLVKNTGKEKYRYNRYTRVHNRGFHARNTFTTYFFGPILFFFPIESHKLYTEAYWIERTDDQPSVGSFKFCNPKGFAAVLYSSRLDQPSMLLAAYWVRHSECTQVIQRYERTKLTSTIGL